MHIDGRFWLTKKGESFLGSGRVELLRWIDKTGSINAAAKAMKMSYKAAWERINAMDALADSPLIERTTGGKGGGGTKLTPYAHEMITAYERFNELHRAFMDRFSEAGEDPDRLARILSRTFLTTSARNQLPAILSTIEHHGIHTTLTLTLSGNDTLRSTITAKSVHNMGLVEGCDTYAIIKSSDVSIIPLPVFTEENCIAGVIESVDQTEENVEISFRLTGGTLLIAVVPYCESVTLPVGLSAYAKISPLHIIIGL